MTNGFWLSSAGCRVPGIPRRKRSSENLLKSNSRRRLFAVGVKALALAAMAWYPLALTAREPVKPVSQDPQAQKLIDQAWAAVDQKIGLPEVDLAIQSLELALALDPDNDALRVELADEYYYRGSLMPAGSPEEIEARNLYFQKGSDQAQQALARRESAGAHAWTTVHLACLKQYTNFLSQAAILPELTRHLQWIEQHDRDYKYGFVFRFWTGVIIQAPDMIVKMLGQDPEEVFENLEQAIAANPGYLENYLYLADLYDAMKRKNQALDTLAKVLQTSPEVFPSERAQNRYAQKQAGERWKKWTRKEYPAR